jgi:pimeloyl-ACP methyl ester carboxylesterase
MDRRIIYCHGLPGSPLELKAFVSSAALPDIQALDRLKEPKDYPDGLLAAFDAARLDVPVTVVGFSLGAMSAAYIAARRASRVRKLVLISPAAPLQLGDFLPAMAGRPVFATAQRGDLMLRFFTAIQAALVTFAPRRVVEMMFSKSPEADRRLLASPEFVDIVLDGLRTCLGQHQAAYRAELSAYVRAWTSVLDEIRCETEIWQGSEDNWAPPAMAQALKDRLGDRATLKLRAGLGHYSTLAAAWAELG